MNYKKQFISNNIDLSCDYDTWGHKKINIFNAITNDALLFLIKELNFKPFSEVNLFTGLPNYSTSIHSDEYPSYALNYAWGDTHAKMFWYNLKKEGHNIKLSTENKPYYTYKEDQVEYVEELDFPNNMLVLVRVNVPHMVINYSNKKRYCLSIRGNPILDWSDIVNHFKNYLI